MSQYQVTAPILAISDEEVGKRVSVTIPAGAVLRDSTQPRTTLIGKAGVDWEGCIGVSQRLAPQSAMR